MWTLYNIGDSTVEDNRPPFRGWGWALPAFIQSDVTVKNHALSGQSSRSFREEGLFEPVERELGPGDLLLIQFGHNDEKDDERHTDPETTFPSFLWSYCECALSRGAQPVLFTPVSRRFFEPDGHLRDTHGAYPDAVRRLAMERGIPLCDLLAESRARFEALGPEDTARLFVRLKPGEHPDFPDGHDDRTHFNAQGAKVVAGLVADALNRLPECAGWIQPEVRP